MRKYNYIFSKLIEGNRDFVGVYAYHLYKKQKIKHIEDYKKENSIQDISEDELEKFHKICSEEESIAGYRSRAEKAIDNFTRATLEEKRKEIEEFYKHSSRHKKSWWYGVGQGFVASALYALFLSIIVVIIWATKTDLLIIIKNILEGRE